MFTNLMNLLEELGHNIRFIGTSPTIDIGEAADVVECADCGRHWEAVFSTSSGQYIAIYGDEVIECK